MMIRLIAFTVLALTFTTYAANADTMVELLQVECVPELDIFRITRIQANAADDPAAKLLSFRKDSKFKDMMWKKYHIIADTGGKDLEFSCAAGAGFNGKINMEFYDKKNTNGGSLSLIYDNVKIIDEIIYSPFDNGDNYFNWLSYSTGRLQLCHSYTEIDQCEYKDDFWLGQEKQQGYKNFPISQTRIADNLKNRISRQETQSSDLKQYYELYLNDKAVKQEVK